MPVLLPTEQVEFCSHGIRCAAWLTLPVTPGPHPAVVLVHGLGATHDMMLAQYEQHFAAAGIAVLAFDYRFTGASEGEPRQHISLRNQRDDVDAALAYLKTRPEIDAGRLGLWGTSLGGMNVVRVAAARDDIAAAVVQCPIVHGPGAARSLGLLGALRLTPAIVTDALRAVTGRGRRYIPIVGAPGGDAMVTVPGAEAGWNSTVAPGATLRQPDRRGGRRGDRRHLCPSPGAPRRGTATGVRVRSREPDGSDVRRAGGPSRTPRSGPALRLRPLRDLPPAARQRRARRPDRLPEGAPRCRVLTCCTATTFGSCPPPRLSTPATGPHPASATSGRTTTCWRTWSSDTAADSAR